MGHYDDYYAADAHRRRLETIDYQLKELYHYRDQLKPVRHQLHLEHVLYQDLDKCLRRAKALTNTLIGDLEHEKLINK